MLKNFQKYAPNGPHVFTIGPFYSETRAHKRALAQCQHTILDGAGVLERQIPYVAPCFSRLVMTDTVKRQENTDFWVLRHFFGQQVENLENIGIFDRKLWNKI